MIKSTEIDTIKEEKTYSICTLVTDLDEYKYMLESFENAGFNTSNSEFIYIDNSKSNKYDAYIGLNKCLNTATGKYIILCHQDILSKYDNEQTLNECIKEVTKIDDTWAILANAGYKDFNNIVLRITDPWGENRNFGPFPSKVVSIDENFILVKNSANLTLSKGINGFHLYGTDLCLISDILGYSTYVIDFHLYHKSAGNANQNFYENKIRFIKHYQNVLTTKLIRTPVTGLFLSSSSALNYLCNIKLCYSLKKRFDKFFEYLRQYL